MSTHSNQAAKKDFPEVPLGANPTSKAHRMRSFKNPSSTSPAGSNKRVKDASVDGSSRTTATTTKYPRSAPMNDGHYKPAK